MGATAGEAKPALTAVTDITADGAEAQKRARGVQPGSFLNLMINSRHQDSGEPFSDDVATSQAFTFLLAGCMPLGYLVSVWWRGVCPTGFW